MRRVTPYLQFVTMNCLNDLKNGKINGMAKITSKILCIICVPCSFLLESRKRYASFQFLVEIITNLLPSIILILLPDDVLDIIKFQ